jgi:hypothetical protein
MSADGSHFEPRSGSLNTILEVDHLRTIDDMFYIRLYPHQFHIYSRLYRILLYTFYLHLVIVNKLIRKYAIVNKVIRKYAIVNKVIKNRSL